LETIGKKYTTYVSMFDNFNLPDLVNYCKENDLRTTGKKKEVIKRILAHLAGEPEVTKTKTKKRKATGGAKKTEKKAKTEDEKSEAKEDEVTK